MIIIIISNYCIMIIIIITNYYIMIIITIIIANYRDTACYLFLCLQRPSAQITRVI